MLGLDLGADDYRLVDCTQGEVAFLAAMVAQADRVHPVGLREHTSGLARDSTDRTIGVHVMNLRRKIEPIQASRRACGVTASQPG